MMPKHIRCDASCVKQRVPLTSWLPRYRRKDIIPDMIAGITVGLTLIPQSIAYAGIAGLEPQYGLYSAFLGSFVYIIFGTVKEVNLGPKALLSLLTFNYTHKLGPEFAVLLCFLCGLFELLCGILNLGILVEFVSTPVVSGFTSAAAITIASSQVKGLLGLKFKSESLIQTWQGVVTNISRVKLGDTVLGLSCCLSLLLLKAMKDYLKIEVCTKSLTTTQKILSKFVWFISTARNAIVVLICACIASALRSSGHLPFMLTGQVKAGLPTFQLPPLTAQVGNTTLTFEEMSRELAPGVVVTSVIAIISNLAIGKAFAKGRILDATQEMMTLGLCNIAGSFVSSMPVAGAFSRSALSSASGVRSPLAGLYTGVMVVLSLSLLTPYFYFIPRATLAAVIMCAVLTLVDYQMFPTLWRASKQDFISCVSAFVACLLFGMEMGILTGVAIDSACLLYTNARPKISADVCNLPGMDCLMVTLDLGLLFPAADHVRAAIQSAGECLNDMDIASRLPVVIDCRNVYKTDYTVAQSLQCLISDLKSHRQKVVFIHVRNDVERLLTLVCTKDLHIATSQHEVVATIAGSSDDTSQNNENANNTMMECGTERQ